MKTSIYLLLPVLITGSASGGIVTFNDRAAFTAATSGLTTIDFGTAAPPPVGFVTTYPSGLTLSGATFSNTVAGFSTSTVSRSYCCPTYARGFDQLATTNPTNSTGASVSGGINVALPSGATAFGLDLFTVVVGNTFGTNQDKVDVTLGGQTFVVATPAAPATIFAGFVSTTPLSSVTIVPELTGAVQPQLDIGNVSFNRGSPASVPEPGTIGLTAGALLALAFRALRRKV
ncbi:MAG: PEP-CTERM sorting domain-containing protein [Acidobacteriota bacterium]|nr:PEP-CTERM sorting domain-containing protein [Acidobacteriota bacterium]